MIDTKRTLEVIENFIRAKNYLDTIYDKSYWYDNCKLLEEAVSELDILQKKETPMKPIQGNNGREDCYHCSNCGAIVHEDYVQHDNNYCSNCGQKLDWRLIK